MSTVVSSKFVMPFLLAVLASPLAQAEDCAAPQRQQGEQVFARDCAACHSAQKDGPVMMGPNLHDVVGRTPGSVPGANYSQAMKTRQAAWTAQAIGAFIAQPQAEVPGTYMPYAGLPDAGERQSVTCFLAGLK